MGSRSVENRAGIARLNISASQGDVSFTAGQYLMLEDDDGGLTPVPNASISPAPDAFVTVELRLVFLVVRSINNVSAKLFLLCLRLDLSVNLLFLAPSHAQLLFRL
jgi:hypothetical protein